MFINYKFFLYQLNVNVKNNRIFNRQSMIYANTKMENIRFLFCYFAYIHVYL